MCAYISYREVADAVRFPFDPYLLISLNNITYEITLFSWLTAEHRNRRGSDLQALSHEPLFLESSHEPEAADRPPLKNAGKDSNAQGEVLG